MLLTPDIQPIVSIHVHFNQVFRRHIEIDNIKSNCYSKIITGCVSESLFSSHPINCCLYQCEKKHSLNPINTRQIMYSFRMEIQMNFGDLVVFVRVFYFSFFFALKI